ncbi:ankyrin repeat-containing domain protein [Colletotrichum acutatum]|uniref:Ankyrin repeat-containing domain protein n=1 Tax=Glomerella acutata TaxID=27357 RepID=A0AAD8UL91_GLOAC|nr:ankyrin repeat-containing domain protein [Colletotrichum acutatum]KAK1723159.1 ankyrin repeat-containing domain protein [Colletotrichum acutatum]
MAPSSCTTDSSETPQSTSANAPLNPLQDDIPDEPTAKLTPPKSSEGSIWQLWDVAYQNLRYQEQSLVQEFEDQICVNLAAGLGAGIRSHAGTKDWLATILKHKMDQVNRESWQLKFGSSEVEVQDVVKPVLAVVDWANDFVAKALVSNPYASIAWSGVSLLLPLLLNPLDQAAALAKGLEHISSLIVRSSMWEDLYVRRYESKTSKASSEPHAAYRLVLERLYREILKFQIVCYRYHNHKTASRMALDSVKHHDWEELLEQIKYHETEFDKVSNHLRDQTYTDEWENAEARHQQAMNHWENIGTDVSDLRRRVERIQNDKKRKELLNWLCIVDPSVQYNAARSKHRSSTCEWLIKDNEDFKTWETAPKSFLWLNGKAGSGKSILSSSVIKHLKMQSEEDPQVALAFGNMEQQKVPVMLSSLIGQLCASRPDTPHLIKKFENYIARKERPDIETFQAALIAVVRGFSAVFIVVDALDECPTLDGERPRLLDCLNCIITAMPDNLHILCTSRAEPDIDTRMYEILSLPAKSAINLTETQVGLDIDFGLYIDSAMAAKTFQYLVCQFEVLQHLNSEDAILSALDDLLLGLDETYDRLLLSLDKAFQPQILASLKWLASSREPLSLRDFAEAFVLRPETIDNLEKKRLFDPKGVLRYFPSLVTTEKRRHENYFEMETCVRLAHFTVKEYLTSDRIQQSRAKHFYFTEEMAHLHIAPCCLSYNLCRSAEDSMADDRDRPLYRYAVLNWAWHLEIVPRTSWTPEVHQLAKRALFPGNKLLGRQWRPYCYTAALGALELTKWVLREDSWAGKFVVQEDLGMALVEAAGEGNVRIAQFLLNKGADANARNSAGCGALQVATDQGNVAVMEVLLDSGADIDAPDEYFGSPLLAAVKNWSEAAVRMLVSRGADVHKAGLNGSTETQAIAIIETLLSMGADVNAPGGGHGTALHIVCFGNRFGLALARLLVEKGAEINKWGNRHGTALHAAYEKGSLELIDFLHGKGADGSITEGEHGNALQAVSVRRINGGKDNLRIVKNLLERGADVNAFGGKFGSALQAAVSNDLCNIELESLLLSKGAEVNRQGGIYGTALQSACASGKMEAVRLLLDHGAEVNTDGGEYGTALQAACGSAHWSRFHDNPAYDIARLLIEHGADVHAQGGKFGSAWHAAAAIGSWKTSSNDLLKLLLDHGVDINDGRGRQHGTALQAALERFRDPGVVVPRVRFLLEHGADVNMEAGRFGFPLQSACVPAPATASELDTRTNINGLVFLLDNCPEIDVNMIGGLHGTALQAATCTGDIEAVELLLRKGADTNTTAGQLGTALQTAAYEGEPEIVELLLARGSDTNIRGGKYRSALNAAIFKGYWDIVEILLDGRARPDCHQLPEPDENKEHGKGAVDRYRKFWDIMILEWSEGKVVKGQNY